MRGLEGGVLPSVAAPGAADESSGAAMFDSAIAF